MRLRNKFLSCAFLFCSMLSIFQPMKSIGDESDNSPKINIVLAEEKSITLEQDKSGNLFLEVSKSFVEEQKDFVAKPIDYKKIQSNKLLDDIAKKGLESVTNSELAKAQQKYFTGSDDFDDKAKRDLAAGAALGATAGALAEMAASFFVVTTEAAVAGGAAAVAAAPTALFTDGAGPVIAGILAGGSVLAFRAIEKQRNRAFENQEKDPEIEKAYFPTELSTEQIYGDRPQKYREINPSSIIQKLDKDGSTKYLIPIDKSDLSGEVVAYYIPNIHGPLINKTEYFPASDGNTGPNLIFDEEEVKVIGPDDTLPNQGPVTGKDGEDKQPVDAGKQGKHVPDHNNHVPGKGKSHWKKGEHGVDETQEAWEKGKLEDKREEKIKTHTTKDGRKIRVHVDKDGNIHGYPVGETIDMPKFSVVNGSSPTISIAGTDANVNVSDLVNSLGKILTQFKDDPFQIVDSNTGEINLLDTEIVGGGVVVPSGISVENTMDVNFVNTGIQGKEKINIVDGTKEFVGNIEFVTTGIDAERQLQAPPSVGGLFSSIDLEIDFGGSRISQQRMRAALAQAKGRVARRSAYDWAEIFKGEGVYDSSNVTMYDLWRYPAYLEFLESNFYDAFKKRIIYFHENNKELKRTFRDLVQDIGGFRTSRATKKFLRKWHVPGMFAELAGEGVGTCFGSENDDYGPEDYVDYKYNQIMEQDHPFTLLLEKLTTEPGRKKFRFNESEFLRILGNQVEHWNDLSLEKQGWLEYILSIALENSKIQQGGQQKVLEFKNQIGLARDKLQALDQYQKEVKHKKELRHSEMKKQGETFRNGRKKLLRRDSEKDKDLPCPSVTYEKPKRSPSSEYKKQLIQSMRSRAVGYIEARKRRSAAVEKVLEQVTVKTVDNPVVKEAKTGFGNSGRSNLKSRLNLSCVGVTEVDNIVVPTISESEKTELINKIRTMPHIKPKIFEKPIEKNPEENLEREIIQEEVVLPVVPEVVIPEVVIQEEVVKEEVVQKEVVQEEVVKEEVVQENSTQEKDEEKNKIESSGDSTINQVGKVAGQVAWNVGVESLAQTAGVLCQRAGNRFFSNGDDILPVDPFRDCKMPFDDGQVHDPIASQIASPFDQCVSPFSGTKNPFGGVGSGRESSLLSRIKKERAGHTNFSTGNVRPRQKRKFKDLIFPNADSQKVRTISTNTNPHSKEKPSVKPKADKDSEGQTGQVNPEPPNKRPRKDDDKKDDDSGKGDRGELSKVSSQEETIKKLLQESDKVRKTMGNTNMYDSSGGYQQALKDFYSLGLKNIKKLSDGRLIGQLKNGKWANIHKSTEDGMKRWTLGFGKNKIRYN